ncbi:Uncharacterised protein [Mycobacteroides abscessus subsp. abscessus]|nr:Uncharacterised protein [Mycobacteroides abscessus subsp. abscessus]
MTVLCRGFDRRAHRDRDESQVERRTDVDGSVCLVAGDRLDVRARDDPTGTTLIGSGAVRAGAACARAGAVPAGLLLTEFDDARERDVSVAVERADGGLVAIGVDPVRADVQPGRARVVRGVDLHPGDLTSRGLQQHRLLAERDARRHPGEAAELLFETVGHPLTQDQLRRHRADHEHQDERSRSDADDLGGATPTHR